MLSFLLLKCEYLCIGLAVFLYIIAKFRTFQYELKLTILVFLNKGIEFSIIILGIRKNNDCGDIPVGIYIIYELKLPVDLIKGMFFYI